MDDMASFTTQLHDSVQSSLFDENGLVTVLEEIGILPSPEQEIDPSQERVIAAVVSIEEVPSEDEGSKRVNQDEDYEEVESVAFGVRERGLIDVDEVSGTTTEYQDLVKIQRTNVEMLLGDDRQTSLLKINSQHSYAAAILDKIGPRQKEENQVARSSRFVDLDDISDTSRSELESSGTQRTNMEIFLDDRGRASLLPMNTLHTDNTDIENRNAIRAKQIKHVAERRDIETTEVDADEVGANVSCAAAVGNLLSGESIEALSHLLLPSAEDLAKVQGSIKKNFVQFRGTNYFPDVLNETITNTSETMSRSWDRIASKVSHNDSDEFIRRMETNIKESMREFNAHREQMIETPNERDALATTRCESAKVEKRDESSREPDLTSELIKDVMVEECAAAFPEHISSHVGACNPSASMRIIDLPQRRGSNRGNGPVDVDAVSLSTTTSEHAQKRREREHRQIYNSSRPRDIDLPKIRESHREHGPVDIDTVSITTTKSEAVLKRREWEHRQRYKSKGAGFSRVICS
uniref:Uncharacterized protein n=1 Tax=Odontella aurita TaxID=265563 RepID=A0A7S4MUE4_9STRA|mmetsp:Transcript_31655/g.94710  ORF Transcript_31655/g.94710 Transcript_31655/m.94710 type:complete len:522 (+) Transcript_31655:321-1886(+)